MQTPLSLGTAADSTRDPLSLCLTAYEVLVPAQVVDELQKIAAYDDDHGRAANAVLGRTTEFTTQAVDLDTEFPLDDGESAAVTLANEIDAALFLCDEFN